MATCVQSIKTKVCYCKLPLFTKMPSNTYLKFSFAILSAEHLTVFFVEHLAQWEYCFSIIALRYFSYTSNKFKTCNFSDKEHSTIHMYAMLKECYWSSKMHTEVTKAHTSYKMLKVKVGSLPFWIFSSGSTPFSCPNLFV